MSTPNHEFPSGTQPQGSGQSPQTPAGYSYPQAQMPWQGQNPQTTWYSDPSQATMQAPQQTTRSLTRRRAEDLFLNVLLYLAHCSSSVLQRCSSPQSPRKIGPALFFV